MTSYFFSKYDYSAVMRNQEAQLKKEVEGIPQRTLLGEAPESLADRLVEKWRINLPTIRRDDAEIEDREIKTDARNYPGRFHVRPGSNSTIPATEFTVSIPFDGDEAVFHIQGNTFGGHVPSGDIVDGHIQLRYVVIEHDDEALKRDIDRDIAAIQGKIRELGNQFTPFNEQLKRVALQAIQNRAEKIRKDKDLVSKLGFKVKRRDDAPQTYVAPAVKRRVSPRSENSQPVDAALDPMLDFAEYQHILSICRNMYRVIERSPAAFEHMEEEHLRDHFLVQLNSQYQGQASGETFNFQGKTDILVRIEGKNIFIAECKFWKGEQAFRETLDQLLGYACWRDSRLALIIFSRNSDFTGVLSKIPSAIKGHQQFICIEKENAEEAEFTYRIRNGQDPNVVHHVAVLVFNVRVPVKALDDGK